MILLIIVGFLTASSLAFSKVEFNSHQKSRIIGGTNAPDGEYPYLASLNYKGNHECGANIINEEWIITVAHCLFNRDINDLKIVAGSNKLDQGGIAYKVLSYVIHEGFINEGTGKHDVAIAKVEKIAFNEKVRKIELETKFVGGNVSVVIGGWGLNNEGIVPNDLQHIRLKTTTEDYCKEKLNGVAPFPLDHNEVCTFTKVGEGLCNHDSGSGLLKEENGKRVLIGLAEGALCADGYPDVFVRISSYFSWVSDKCNCL